MPWTFTPLLGTGNAANEARLDVSSGQVQVWLNQQPVGAPIAVPDVTGFTRPGVAIFGSGPTNPLQESWRFRSFWTVGTIPISSPPSNTLDVLEQGRLQRP